MSRRGENIHKRKDGRWEGRFIQDRGPSGKAIYKSVYGRTYKEVRKKLFDAKTNEFHESQELLFKELIHAWLDGNRIRYKKSTLTKYNYLIEKHIIPELGDLKAKEISAYQINSFLERKQTQGRIDGRGGLSTTYIRSITLIIKSVLNYGTEEGLCLPLKSTVYKPIPEKKELQILTPEEFVALKAYCCSEITDTSLGVLITLNTGLRIGEICALKWENIDLENQVIYVKNTLSRSKGMDEHWMWELEKPKTPKSVRIVPIPMSLIRVLRKYLPQAPEHFVLSGQSSFLCPRTFEYRYHKLLNNSGIPQINFHALRHSFATRCVEAGIDIKTLSELLGHSNVGITLNIYVHSSLEWKRAEIEKFDQCFQ